MSALEGRELARALVAVFLLAGGLGAGVAVALEQHARPSSGGEAGGPFVVSDAVSGVVHYRFTGAGVLAMAPNGAVEIGVTDATVFHARAGFVPVSLEGGGVSVLVAASPRSPSELVGGGLSMGLVSVASAFPVSHLDGMSNGLLGLPLGTRSVLVVPVNASAGLGKLVLNLTDARRPQWYAIQGEGNGTVLGDVAQSVTPAACRGGSACGGGVEVESTGAFHLERARVVLERARGAS